MEVNDMEYREKSEDTVSYRTEYVDGLGRVIAARQAECKRIRESRNMFENTEEKRVDFINMLGWPLTEKKPVAVEPEKIFLAKEDGMEIYRLRFEILPGLKFTGLFFKHTEDGVLPFAIASHGGLGTPELMSGVYGFTDNYNDLLMRIFKEGVNVFAPQLLLWGSQNIGAPFDRKEIDAHLKQVGSSITAIEVYGIECAISYFEKQSFVSKIGMAGLSYGGFYTLFTAAADTRIKAALSCSFFNDRDKFARSDWTWQNSAEKFFDAEVACLVYPRKLWIRIGDKDGIFVADDGIKEFERLCGLCAGVGTDFVDFAVFDGTHEFVKDDKTVKDFCNELKK